MRLISRGKSVDPITFANILCQTTKVPVRGFSSWACYKPTNKVYVQA